MKTEGVYLSLCRLLIVSFLALSSQSCEDSSTKVQLVVNNIGTTGFTVTINKESQFVAAGDSASFDVPANTNVAVSTSDGFSGTVYVGNAAKSISISGPGGVSD